MRGRSVKSNSSRTDSDTSLRLDSAVPHDPSFRILYVMTKLYRPAGRTERRMGEGFVTRKAVARGVVASLKGEFSFVTCCLRNLQGSFRLGEAVRRSFQPQPPLILFSALIMEAAHSEINTNIG